MERSTKIHEIKTKENKKQSSSLPSVFPDLKYINLPVKSAQSNIMIGSKELGLRPDGTNVQKVGC